eukprot:TRINITY_DN36848_c0_g1_i1.p1 TRINITY_DN36848_c0_g1~~TRINITY_DN36848_c0_g1_i1.p1  ORF type:complete len:544 (-),score=126.62 TRINITY_DN36848_c0_g1_i1:38-1576(-)
MSDSALDLVRAGRVEEAADIWGECFELRKAALGPTHEDTLGTMARHASCLGFLGRYEEAEEQHRLCFQLRKVALGPAHPDTLASMCNNAFCLCELGHFEEAEERQRLCCRLREEVLGTAHPDTLISMFAHARVLAYLGRTEEAEEEERRCCELSEEMQDDKGGAHPKVHPKVLASIEEDEDLSDTEALERWEQAEEKLQQCLEPKQEALSKADEDGGTCCICFHTFSAEDPPASQVDAEAHGIVFVCEHADAMHISCLLREATQDRPFQCPLCRSKFGFSRRCICGSALEERRGNDPVPEYEGCGVKCDHCDRSVSKKAKLFHCPLGKIDAHPNGYDVCARCARGHDEQAVEEVVDTEPEAEAPEAASSRATGSASPARGLQGSEALRLAAALVTDPMNRSHSTSLSSIRNGLPSSGQSTPQTLRRSRSFAAGSALRAVRGQSQVTVESPVRRVTAVPARSAASSRPQQRAPEPRRPDTASLATRPKKSPLLAMVPAMTQSRYMGGGRWEAR